MSPTRESSTRAKFATQVDAETLSAIRSLAKSEGRQLQALVDEAFTDLLEKRRQGKPRPHVMALYQGSHEKYGPLYQKLAE